MMEIEHITVLGRLVTVVRLGKAAAFRLQDLEVTVHRIIPDAKDCPEDVEPVITVSKMSENLKCDEEARRHAGRQ